MTPQVDRLSIATSVIKNARRLFDDAEILMNSSSYASATALYVMSCEEFGKLVMLINGKNNSSDPLNNKQYHKSKHEAAAIQHHAQSAIDAAREFLSRIGLNIVKIEDVPPEFPIIELTEFLSRMPKHKLTEFGEYLEHHFAGLPSQARIAETGSPGAEVMRKRALYLDFNEHGVVGSPDEITENDAKNWRDYAVRCLALVEFSDVQIRAIRLDHNKGQGSTPTEGSLPHTP